MKRILFISHESSLTGGAIVFLNLLKELYSKRDFIFDIVSLRAGPLDQDYSMIGDYFGHKIKSSGINFLQWRRRVPKYNLIYANTIASLAAALQWKQRFGCQLILHVHELQNAFEELLSPDMVVRMSREVDHFIVVSQAVKQNLIHRYAIPDHSITLVYESIPFPPDAQNICEDDGFNQFVAENFVVGGSGSISWRKGTDLFLSTAKRIKDHDLPYKFVWVGGHADSVEFRQVLFEIKMLGLENTVFLRNTVKNPMPYFNRFDLFFLSSREDPFPLVCLENAALAKPVICFEGSGGIPELLENDKRCMIPYGSIEDASKTIQWFAEHRNEAKTMGLTLQSRVSEKFDIKDAAKQITGIIKKVTNDE